MNSGYFKVFPIFDFQGSKDKANFISSDVQIKEWQLVP